MKAIKGKKIFMGGDFVEGCVCFDRGKIVVSDSAATPFDEIIDAKDDLVLPGFIDIHTHGALNVDFAEGTPSDILKAVGYHLSNGVTGILPTITSSTVPQIMSALKNVKDAMRDEKYGKCILGAHLEGPYLSTAQCGAQDKSLITAPIESDYKEIIERYGDVIKRWDYAPERDEDGKFCAYIKSKNIIPSAGHTDAKYNDMLVARANGCNCITHFYSCTSTITRERGERILGVLECGYLWDDIYTEIIADGKHLPKELLRLIFKLKNADKIILVSDSLKVAGSGEKYSSVGNVKCVIEDGVCKLLDRSAFAGSIVSGAKLISTCVSAGIKAETAVNAFTENPAALLGINAGRISIGNAADFVITDEFYNVKKVILKGETVFGK